MATETIFKRQQAQPTKPSHHDQPPRNPNKRPTTINMNRSIARMKANTMDAIRSARLL